MRGVRGQAARFGLFALAALLLLGLLVSTMRDGLDGDARDLRAVFADVSGLRVGDDVRAAGVRVGRVEQVEVRDDGRRDGAVVRFALEASQPLLDDTRLEMRYQDLLGRRYLALVQGPERGRALEEGATVPLGRTSPGFDLTELLNGFRPLFEVLEPADVNALATSVVRVLQGEGGTVEQLLQQTTRLTDFVADRDALLGDVLTTLTPVLRNLADQGPAFEETVVELRRLMTGLAADREALGRSVDGVGELVGATSALLRDVRRPTVRAVRELVVVARVLAATRARLAEAVRAFGSTFESLGRATSYENALNIYVCSFYATGAGQAVNPAGDDGPWSEVCR